MTDARLDVDVVIVGAGAAGLMCAAQAGRRGRRVLVLDHWRKIGERIRVSGGGRCNFTNRSVSPANYVSGNPHFCRSALSRFTPDDFVALLDQHGIAYEERDSGQLFCVQSAHDITRMLIAECEAATVRVAHGVDVGTIERPSPADGGRTPRFSVATSHGTYQCESLVVATGGLAVPKLGATPLGYRIAEQFGLPVVAPRPGLVPFGLAADVRTRLSELSGVAFTAEVSCAVPGAPSFTGSVLITHQGVSGPAILQISNYWPGQAPASGASPALTLNLLPGTDAALWLQSLHDGRSTVAGALATRLPRRFAQAWASLHAAEQPINQMTRAEIDRVAHALNRWELRPSGTLGFEKAEVTLGGVDTSGLSSKTLEAARVPGLYFIGEVVDVTGWLGGYNFQWAWSSGVAAGRAV